MKAKPKRKVSQFRIVEIEWFDSVGLMSVWEVREEIEPLQPSPIITVGYLWEEAKDFVTVCQSQSRMQVARRFSIPRACIKSIRIIRK